MIPHRAAGREANHTAAPASRGRHPDLKGSKGAGAPETVDAAIADSAEPWQADAAQRKR